MNLVQKISSCFIFPALVLAGHLIATKGLALYAIFPNLDMPFHFIGGVSIGYTTIKVLGFLQSENLIARIDKTILLLLLFTTTATAAVFWEFMEFTTDWMLGTNIQVSLANTMQDQFLGILGGSLVLIAARKAP